MRVGSWQVGPLTRPLSRPASPIGRGDSLRPLTAGWCWLARVGGSRRLAAAGCNGAIHHTRLVGQGVGEALVFASVGDQAEGLVWGEPRGFERILVGLSGGADGGRGGVEDQQEQGFGDHQVNADQATDVDLTAGFLTRFAHQRLNQVFACLDPSARQLPTGPGSAYQQDLAPRTVRDAANPDGVHYPTVCPIRVRARRRASR